MLLFSRLSISQVLQLKGLHALSVLCGYDEVGQIADEFANNYATDTWFQTTIATKDTSSRTAEKKDQRRDFPATK